MNNQGILYMVATPIGNLADMTFRAIETLKQVDVIAAEDTRHSQRLLQHYHIATPLISLHAHNEQQRVSDLIEKLQQGKSVAVISDAGTPLISDPGYTLILEAHRQDIRVVPVPGASALIAALSVAGLPAHSFIFEGFLPVKTSARCQKLQTLQEETRTLIFYEAPHRILAMLLDLKTVFGGDRYVVLARELTKTFESIHGANLNDLIPWLEVDPHRQKGEFVILVHGDPKKPEEALDDETMRILTTLLKELPVKQAVKLAVQITGQPRNLLYDWAVKS